MHAHPVFADFLAHYGRVCASIVDAGVLEKLGRLFWYTVEFGVNPAAGRDQGVWQWTAQLAR